MNYKTKKKLEKYALPAVLLVAAAAWAFNKFDIVAKIKKMITVKQS